jgi:hypothetical protein
MNRQRQLPPKERSDEATILCCSHSGCIGVDEPDRNEFKSAHLAVCAVGEQDGERNAIKTASYRGDIGHEVLLMHGRPMFSSSFETLMGSRTMAASPTKPSIRSTVYSPDPGLSYHEEVVFTA